MGAGQQGTQGADRCTLRRDRLLGNLHGTKLRETMPTRHFKEGFQELRAAARASDFPALAVLKGGARGREQVGQ